MARTYEQDSQRAKRSIEEITHQTNYSISMRLDYIFAFNLEDTRLSTILSKELEDYAWKARHHAT